MGQTITGLVSVAAQSPAGAAVTPQQFGGIPDGTTDNFEALTKAMQTAASSGLPVFLSTGTWFANVDTSVHPTAGWNGITVPPGVEVYGGPGAVCTSSVQYEDYPLFGLQGHNYIHDLAFTHPTGSNMINSAAGASNLKVANCTFDHACLNSLFACVDSIIENCKVNGAATRANTTAPINAGTVYSSVPCSPLTTALGAGNLLYLYLYPNGIFAPGIFQTVTTSAAVPVGAESIPVKPFIASASLPTGALVQQIIVSTGIAMTGDYPSWSTAAPGPGGHWCVNSTIQNCTVLNCNAADIFINMGYKCFIQNNFGWVGHDMPFDFEFCMQSIMQGNEAHFGGNRGCAVESINSACQVLDNKVFDTASDGIRVTNDGGYIPANNPYNLGGHLVEGNTVLRSGRGIALQGATGTVKDNVVQQCAAYGVWMNNLPSSQGPTLLTGNTITDNYGNGVGIQNSSGITIDGTNEIGRNGYLGGVAPNRAPLALSLVPSSGSALLSGTGYAVSCGWGADVSVGGLQQVLHTSPGLPAFATPTASGQGIAFDVALPVGIDSISVWCTSQANAAKGAGLTAYPVPSGDWTENVVLGSTQILGYVDAAGNVTYAYGSAAGLTASVNADGSLHVIVTAAASTNQSVNLTWRADACAGILCSPQTGAITNITVEGTKIHDNGYAGIWGSVILGSASLPGPDIATHTAIGIFHRGWGGTVMAGGSVSGCYQGILAGRGSPSTISGVAFNAIQDSCIRLDGGVSGGTVEGCNFGSSGTGVRLNGKDGASAPLVVSGCDFSGCKTPIDYNGGTPSALVTIGAGNTGLPAS